MRFTSEELESMSASERNKILFRQPVYYISKDKTIIFGSVEEKRLEDGWAFYKVDWHNKEKIIYAEYQMPEWIRQDKVFTFSVKEFTHLLSENYSF